MSSCHVVAPVFSSMESIASQVEKFLSSPLQNEDDSYVSALSYGSFITAGVLVPKESAALDLLANSNFQVGTINKFKQANIDEWARAIIQNWKRG